MEAVRLDLLRNIHPPFESHNAQAMFTTLQRLIVTFENREPLGWQDGDDFPEEELVMQACELADKLVAYQHIANHYFDVLVKRERLSRPSDVVAAEIDAVSNASAKVKASFIEFTDKVIDELRGAYSIAT